MARAIYEIKLKNRLFPALNEQDALEMQETFVYSRMHDEDVVATCVVQEEHTMKLFFLAKSMYDAEKFEYLEVKAAVSALALKLGYYTTHEEVADCVISWVERVAEDMTVSELEEWLIG